MAAWGARAVVKVEMLMCFALPLGLPRFFKKIKHLSW